MVFQYKEYFDSVYNNTDYNVITSVIPVYNQETRLEVLFPNNDNSTIATDDILTNIYRDIVHNKISTNEELQHSIRTLERNIK